MLGAMVGIDEDRARLHRVPSCFPPSIGEADTEQGQQALEQQSPAAASDEAGTQAGTRGRRRNRVLQVGVNESRAVNSRVPPGLPPSFASCTPGVILPFSPLSPALHSLERGSAVNQLATAPNSSTRIRSSSGRASLRRRRTSEELGI